MTALSQRTTEQLRARARELTARLDQLKAAGLALDLTRGKPAADQLDLSNALDGILRGDYRLKDGTDARNYGGLLGIPEARALGAALLDTTPDRVIAGGNSSLGLMQLVVDAALRVGLWGDGSAWQRETGAPAFPVSGARIRPSLRHLRSARHRDGHRADDRSRAGHGRRRSARRC